MRNLHLLRIDLKHFRINFLPVNFAIVIWLSLTLCQMQFKEAEIELFIEEKNILSIRSQKIVMFIQSPESQKLEGYLMIRKMILALGFNA